MSVFRTIPPGNISITPFQSYAYITFDSIVSTDGINMYQVEFDNYKYSISDISAPENSNLVQTSDNRYEQIIFHSVNHLFYLNYHKKPISQTFGEHNKFQKRNLDKKITMFSIERNKYVEGIKPESIALSIIDSGSGLNLTIIDDKHGNLIDSNIYTASQVTYDAIMPNLVCHYDFNDGFLYNNTYRDGIIPNYTMRNYVEYYNTSIEDKSPIRNDGTRNEMTFSRGERGMYAVFNGINSFIKIPDNFNTINFSNKNEYAISFFVKTTDSDVPLIVKNGKETEYQNQKEVDTYGKTRNSTIVLEEDRILPVYPFHVGINGTGNVYLKMSDGVEVIQSTSTTAINDGNWHHVICQKTSSKLQVIVSGSLEGETSYSDIELNVRNNSPVFLGRLTDTYFSGALDEVKIFNDSLNSTRYASLASLEQNNTFNYYVGNVFYNMGFIILTSPYYYNLTDSFTYTLELNATKTIFEHEFICQLDRGDFNQTLNYTTYLYANPDTGQIDKTYLSGSFSPYITSVGLYDEHANLLAVGKLSRPIQKSKTNDMTFIIRFDT